MFTVQTEQFQGPLDVLLGLIEKEDLDISELSLSAVTDPYLAYVERLDDSQTSEIADFLVVAAKLVWIKSKRMLPRVEIEDQEQSLEDQLRAYKRFVDAAAHLEQLFVSDHVSYLRQKAPLTGTFTPPKHISGGVLEQVMQSIVAASAKKKAVVERIRVEKVISIEQSIAKIRSMLSVGKKMRFSKLMKKSAPKGERIVHFLALLELVKQRQISLNQGAHFDDIHITPSRA